LERRTRKRKKKQALIRQIQAYYANPEVMSISRVSEAFGITYHTAKKYILMTEDIINNIDSVQPKKRIAQADDYLNIIYKMQRDGYSDNIIFHYVIQQGYEGNTDTLWKHMYHISINNFPNRKAYHSIHYMERRYPEDIIVIKRNSLLKYILTIDPKKKRDKTIECYIDKIKEKYPAVETTEKMFLEFHATIMGKNPDAIDEYIEKYEDSKLEGFCDGIKKDIVSVKNAISQDISSGFVEGNNNKFKLIKRILYGRAKLDNLAKKSMTVFAAKDPNFSLSDLL